MTEAEVGELVGIVLAELRKSREKYDSGVRLAALAHIIAAEMCRYPEELRPILRKSTIRIIDRTIMAIECEVGQKDGL